MDSQPIRLLDVVIAEALVVVVAVVDDVAVVVVLELVHGCETATLLVLSVLGKSALTVDCDGMAAMSKTIVGASGAVTLAADDKLPRNRAPLN